MQQSTRGRGVNADLGMRDVMVRFHGERRSPKRCCHRAATSLGRTSDAPTSGARPRRQLPDYRRAECERRVGDDVEPSPGQTQVGDVGLDHPHGVHARKPGAELCGAPLVEFERDHPHPERGEAMRDRAPAGAEVENQVARGTALESTSASANSSASRYQPHRARVRPDTTNHHSEATHLTMLTDATSPSAGGFAALLSGVGPGFRDRRREERRRSDG